MSEKSNDSPALAPQNEFRIQQQWLFSLDGGNWLAIQCPFGLSQVELAEIKEFLAIFTRQAEHYSIPEKETENAETE